MRNEKGQFTTRKEWFDANCGGWDFPNVTEDFEVAEKRLANMVSLEKKIKNLLEIAERNGRKVTTNYHLEISKSGTYAIGYGVESKEDLHNLMLERIKKQAEIVAVMNSPLI